MSVISVAWTQRSLTTVELGKNKFKSSSETLAHVLDLHNGSPCE